MTSVSGAFGQAITGKLLAEGVKSVQGLKFGGYWTYDDYHSTIPTLTNTDILIIAHGSKSDHTIKANCESAIQLIHLFKQHRKARSSNDMLLR